MNHSRYTRWWMLLLLCVAECLGMSLWMTASSITPQLAELWTLTSFQSGWLTTSVQIGFVAGTLLLALSNIADLGDNRKLFAISCVGAAVGNGLLIFCNGFGTAILCRFVTGLFLAGVYPPGMKMISTWFTSFRGLAIGSLVGALTIGKATPYLLKFAGDGSWQAVVGWSSFGALVAALLVAMFYRTGPARFGRKPFSWSLVGEVISHRPTRLATLGYLGHMWELYAMWTWVPAFLVAAAAASPDDIHRSTVDLVSFATIAIGGLGCIIGGVLADKTSRAKVVNSSMAVSGICCLLSALVFGLSFWVVVGLTLLWGLAVVADSAQFSAMVTEVAPQHAVGTALALQTSFGFLLTVITIQWVPLFVESVGWRFAFVFLALGPAFGIRSIRKLTSGT